ncbi:MAG: beta-xylosidase [Polyangiaceae bacterium]
MKIGGQSSTLHGGSLESRGGRFVPPLFASLLPFALSTLLSAPVAAATTLTVDLSTTTGPVTHAASGSLYGVTEKLPADVMALIAPLHPRMFNNPAADQQQPVGDAIVVAGRLAPTGAMVTIRLADWFKGFYTFTTMADWFDKLGQTVSRKKAANLTNIYAYEIWNEPNGTYSSNNPLSFNEFWRQSFAKLRELDPGVKITGPSFSFYNEASLKSFLSFCKTNSCLPDIVGWHELGGGNLTGTLQSYRALEKQLGIGPLPISINEYSGGGDLAVEGQPGASAPLIAKFERFGVDSACISFWDVPHPGRLGSLLATNTDPNGGWWFYKWYGDMTGNMVSTTPPTPQSATALDGFANLDAPSGSASVLFGGVNDGSIQIVVKGFKAAPYFGNTVHAVVEHTPFANRSTVVKAIETLSTADLPIANDQVTVSVANANAKDGYRLRLISLTGGAGAAGAAAGGAAAGGAAGGGTNPNGAGGVTSTGGNAGGSGLSDSVGGGGPGGLPSSTGGGMTGGDTGAAGNLSAANGGGASGCTCQLKRSPTKPPAAALLLLFSLFGIRRTKRSRCRARG